MSPTTDPPIRIQPDSWLAQRLECEAFKISCSSECDPAGVAAFFAKRAPGFCFSKVPTSAVSSVMALANAGFYVVDVNVTLDLVKPVSCDDLNNAEILVQDVEPVDHDTVLDIAATCFVYSRFHLDPQISNSTANRIKRDWLENYIRGERGERLLVAHRDGRPIGFLAVIAGDSEGRTCRTIDLVGVARDFQRRGVGRSLVAHFVQRYAGRVDLLRVGTQAANVPSLRLYESSGFKIVDTQYVLHAHF